MCQGSKVHRQGYIKGMFLNNGRIELYFKLITVNIFLVIFDNIASPSLHKVWTIQYIIFSIHAAVSKLSNHLVERPLI